MSNVFLCFLLLVAACGQNNSYKNDYNLTNKKKNNYSGTYEYVYPGNTADLIENHFIELTLDDDKISGYYYGTSDEFDEAREGYLPAFFVAYMDNLKIVNDTITFTLNVNNSDFLTQAVDLQYKSTNDAIKAGYKTWANKISPLPKEYRGIFKDSKTIFFKGEKEFLDKTFIKK